MCLIDVYRKHLFTMPILLRYVNTLYNVIRCTWLQLLVWDSLSWSNWLLSFLHYWVARVTGITVVVPFLRHEVTRVTIISEDSLYPRDMNCIRLGCCGSEQLTWTNWWCLWLKMVSIFYFFILGVTIWITYVSVAVVFTWLLTVHVYAKHQSGVLYWCVAVSLKCPPK